MDLFVINRADPDDQPKVEKTAEEDEKSKLETVLRQIERRKQLRIRQREREKLKHSQPPKPEKPAEEETPAEEKTPEEPQPEPPLPQPEPTETENPKPKKTDPLQSIIEGFTVLGSHTTAKKPHVKRVLPNWLLNPTVISSDLQNLTAKVSEIEALDKNTRRLLKQNGIKFLFPVQAEVIPWLLKVNGHADVMFPPDICVSAPTGSGKTLAFALPVIQVIKDHMVRQIRALVILPTQDLAHQVFKTFKTYTQGTNLETSLITGKNSFAMEQKQLGYQNVTFGYVNKVDILVCTAGRLVSHLKETEGFCLKSLEFLIIDEADRVLESVQDDWLYHLEKHIYEDESSEHNRKILNVQTLQKHRPPQKLLFSATLSQDPEKLEKLSLFQPKLFTCMGEETENAETEADTFIGKYATPRELTEKYLVCSKDLKPLILYTFIKSENLTKTIVFTHSIESAHRLSILLRSLFKDKMKIEEISSSLKGRNRTDLIRDFEQGNIDVLICTDALSRGIDLPGVQCVISYSAPKYLKTYIHRAGRTARAGELGLALTLVHKEQVSQFRALLNQMTKSKIDQLEVPEEELEPLGKKYKKALDKLKDTIQVEEETGLKKLKTQKRKQAGGMRKKSNY